jgi:hypothetical protein
MLLVVKLVTGLLLVFSLTELPPSFRILSAWVAMAVFLFSLVRSLVHRRYVFVVLWLLCLAWVQPFWRPDLSEVAYGLITLAVGTWCMISPGFEEVREMTEAEQIARRAKAEGPQAKRRVGGSEQPPKK